MEFLGSILEASTEYQQFLAAVGQKLFPIELSGLATSHKCHIVYALLRRMGKKCFLFAQNELEAQRMAGDFTSMGLRAVVYPFRDFNFQNIESASKDYERQRLRALAGILTGRFDVVISSLSAALEYTIAPIALGEKIYKLSRGQTVSLDALAARLVSYGYEKYDQVDSVGQFSIRGGILDVFTPSEEFPVRLELWGDEIDTLSLFDPQTQRRTKEINGFELIPAREIILASPKELAETVRNLAADLRGDSFAAAVKILQKEAEMLENGILPKSIDKFIPLLENHRCTLFDYISREAFVFFSQYSSCTESLRAFEWQFGEDLQMHLADGTLCPGLDCYTKSLDDAIAALENRPVVYLNTFSCSAPELPACKSFSINAVEKSPWNGSMASLCEILDGALEKNSRCVVLAGTERAAKAVAGDLCSHGFAASFYEDVPALTPGTVAVLPGALSAGLEYPEIPFCLVSHANVQTADRKTRKSRQKRKEIYSISELKSGDYVVHSAHGIGIFEGIHKMKVHGVSKDYIKVKYAKGDTLYVPVTQLDLISKYIGSKEDAHVKVHHLGGSEWSKTKKRVRSAVKDMAKELIKLYSERMQAPGHAFAPDNEWQKDFEAHFEHEETLDQLECISEIKADMERTAPMDRLLCGDVGFGKTEVALRAAFKCVTDSKQCAILVPTTILAMQHYETICQRFEGFPVRIELLSRFRTPKQQKEILRQLENGDIDIIVGTHRLVQKDVRFRALGLAIIDEEQRFGVAQKEKFKELYKNVDILTLSATPIPRTLNMALSGIRDMSTLEEAPQNRFPVQTYVLEYDPVIIKEAIVKELRRGGQVFYLHNKVESIERIASSLQLQIPEAKVGYGHGKMSESELSKVWQKMIEKEINVLVCTTIIETGVDLPNVNTLIIDNADHMGLSQLHQLRGRVGRSSRHAYAYFTFRKNKVLSEISQKRLSAIREFTEFGSGFKIAMRDLELRGAGNILSASQHGHMEDVGYDMYLKLLGQAISEEKGETIENYELECLVDIQLDAHIPESYIANLSHRLEFYRRISDIRTHEDALEVTDELIDRFGDPPKSVQGLIDVALIRSEAARMGVYEIAEKNDTLSLYQKKFDVQQVANIIKNSKYKVLFNAGNKPHLFVKLRSGDSPIAVLREILEAGRLR